MPSGVKFALTGLNQIHRRIEAGQRGVLRATAKALTFTAERAQRRVTKIIPRVFDKPTPFTRKSVRKTTANVLARGPLSSNVYFKDIRANDLFGEMHYLQPQVAGGTRVQKRAEKRLGGYWVPGKDARLNKYGNLTRGTWNKALADIGKYGQFTGDAANTLTKAQGGTKRILYFLRRHKNGRRVIYKKVRKRIIPWMVEVSRPQYRVRLRFRKIVTKVAAKEYGPLFDKAMQRELAKAG